VAALALLAASSIGLPRQLAPIDAPTRLLGQFLYGVMAVALLVPAAFAVDTGGRVRRLLRARAVVLLGAVSYGIYLWHLAFLERAVRWTGGELFAASLAPVLALGLAATIAVAAASYVVIEKPVVRTGGRAQPIDRG
jgi:peptidoglycan/LPS O-acetylase OafA/YrhL